MASKLNEKLTYGMLLMAAPEIWFGPESLKYFDKFRILSFPDAIVIKEIEANIIYVKLFDAETPDYEAEEILDLQKEFRTWIKMDEIELKLNEIVASKPPEPGSITESILYK